MCEVIWDCPICKTENRDLTDETAMPICSRCETEHDWSEIQTDNLALFETDSNGESTGTVHHYCSESCRQAGKRTLIESFSVGRSDGALEDEQCSHCGLALLIK